MGIVVDLERLRKSAQITQHDQLTCAPCKGASLHHDDHYALGKLRLKIAAELEYDYESGRQLSLATLLERWHAKRKEEHGQPRPEEPKAKRKRSS